MGTESPTPAVTAQEDLIFRYEPLKLSGKPSLRLATLLPGPRTATVRINLVNRTFAERPRYEALSYTWGSPDPKLRKEIELNGFRSEVRENLWLALLHLRDPAIERVLWIDAICINQDDLEERNKQVVLMAYIYSRATQVQVWLGIITQSVYASGENDEPESLNTHTLCCKPYWGRVWIVQEIGAATSLQLNWGLIRDEGPSRGSDVWTSRTELWDRFFGRIRRQQMHNLALTLADQREGRHGDSFLLANLMEVCKHSQCEEPRDKVYGFIGVAHDCQDGSFPVDYSKSLLEIYEDVIRFQYRSSNSASMSNARTIVHFSQLVQNLFGGPRTIQKDVFQHYPDGKNPLSVFDSIKTRSNALKTRTNAYRVLGIHGGNISIVGCSYNDFIALPDATRRWKVALLKCYADMEKLRLKNEGFMRVLLELKESVLDSIQPIEPKFAWKGTKQLHQLMGIAITESRSAWELIPMFNFGPLSPDDASVDLSQHYLFATHEGNIGLMPASAKIGDRLFHFWNSDSVAVVRQEGKYHARIVGRAVVANKRYIGNSMFYTPGDSGGKHLDFEKGVDLYMDIRTLQLMTQ